MTDENNVGSTVPDVSLNPVPDPVVADPIVPADDSVHATDPVPVSEPLEEAPKVYYMGQEVVEKLDEVTGDGRHCRLADGSTAYVPLNVLGE